MPIFLFDKFSDIPLEADTIMIPDNYKIRRVINGEYNLTTCTEHATKDSLSISDINSFNDIFLATIANNILMEGVYMCNVSQTPNPVIRDLLIRLLYFISNRDVSSIYSVISSISKETSERYKRYCDTTTKFSNHINVNTRIKSWTI
jgi:hypothetical protein